MADLIGAANAIKVTSARKIMVVTKGNDGRTAYVHFKFSAVYPSADSDLKDTPDTYIGVCSDFSEKAPTAFTAYTWYIWKGDVGRTPVTLHGTAITGTGNSISAEIAGALIGDFYINSDTCNMYTCVAVNTWNYVTCVKGDPGGAVAHASSHAVGGTDPVTITLPGQATGMLDALHGGTGVDDVAKIVPAFTPSTSFAAPASGDTLSTLFAKIAPWTTDSGKLSVSGSFATGTLSYQKIGKLVEIYFSGKITAAITAYTTSILALPAGYIPSDTQDIVATYNETSTAPIYLASDGIIRSRSNLTSGLNLYFGKMYFI